MVQCDPVAEQLGRKAEIAPLGEWMSGCDSSLTAKRADQAQVYEGVEVLTLIPAAAVLLPGAQPCDCFVQACMQDDFVRPAYNFVAE